MFRQILVNKKKINYKVRQSNRAKKMRLAVYPDGSVVATQPRGVSLFIIEEFIRQRADWLISKINISANLKRTIPQANQSDYLANKSKAVVLVKEKIKKLNQVYKFEFNRVSVRNQKTRWGSCSQKGNLNFNYRIIYLPDQVADYLVVHELCHLKELNHSQRFWNLVAETIPDYLNIKKELRFNR